MYPQNLGWILVHRKIIKKGWYKNSKYVHLWLHLLLKANHEETELLWNGKIEKIKPGQFITGRKTLAEETGLSQSTIERILELFEKEHQIGQQKNNKFRLIEVRNWQLHQKVDNQRTTNGHLADTNKQLKQLNNTTEQAPTKTKLMYEEPIIELDENGEELTPLPKKYKDKRKLYCRVINYYKELTNEPAPTNRYLPAMKDLVVIAEDICETEEDVERELKVRIKVAVDFCASKNFSHPSLERIAKVWNELPKWREEIKK